MVDWEENCDVDLRFNNFIEFIFKIESIGTLLQCGGVSEVLHDRLSSWDIELDNSKLDKISIINSNLNIKNYFDL